MPVMDVKHGTFSWIDVMTTDASVAVPFYEEVFGWTTQDVPGGAGPYMMFFKGETPAAGLGEMSEEMKAQGAPPAWNSYVQVDDVDATTARVPELGGEIVVPPMDAGEHGRMSVIRDPSGAHVSLWQTFSEMDEGTYNEAGLLTWNEHLSRDTAAAREFYSELLGWGWDEMDMPQGTYWVIMNGDRPNGGLMAMTDEWPAEVPAHWMVYIGSDDVDATAAAVKAAGGQIMVEPMDISVGRFCVAQDPTGAAFTVFKGGDM